jgi:hypothetical protein
MADFSRLSGKFLAASRDSTAVADEPMQGKVVFTPRFTRLADKESKSIRFPGRVEAVLDATGELTRDGMNSLVLLCPVEGDEVQWEWHVAPDVQFGGKKVSVSAWTVRMWGGKTYRLEELVPSVPATLTPSKGITKITADDGGIKFHLGDGTDYFVPLPDTVKGSDGRGIVSVVAGEGDAEGVWTVTYTDDTSDRIKIPKGEDPTILVEAEAAERKKADNDLAASLTSEGSKRESEIASVTASVNAEVAARTALEARFDELSGGAGDLATVKNRLDDLEQLTLVELRKFVSSLVQKQLNEGVGIVYAGSSTAEGYGSAGMGSNDYNGRAWAERVNAVLTPRTLNWNVNNGDKKPSTGIQGWQFSVGGTTSSNYLPDNKIEAIGSIKPQLMFHAVGSNNYGNQWGLDDYERDMRETLAKIDRVSPDTRHVMVTYQTLNGLNGNNPPLKWWQYNERLKKVALEHPRSYFLDLSDDAYAMGMPGANHWWFYQTDENHVHATTHRYYAARILDQLGLPVPPEGPENYVWSTIGGGDKAVGSTVATRSVGKRAYPRMIVTSGVLFGRSASNGGYFNLALKGNTDSNRSLSTNATTNPIGMALNHTFYCPPGVEGVVTLSVDNTAGYISGANEYQNIVSTGYLV